MPTISMTLIWSVFWSKFSEILMARLTAVKAWALPFYQIQIQFIFIVPYKIQHFILYWLKYNKFVHGGGTDKEKKGG
jgi:hypothetical protein